MKRMLLLLAATALLALTLCGCERGAGSQHTSPPKVTPNVTASPSPTSTPAPTPAPTSTPDVTETPDVTPDIPDATDAPVTEVPDSTPGAENETGADPGNGDIPQPRRGGLL